MAQLRARLDRAPGQRHAGRRRTAGRPPGRGASPPAAPCGRHRGRCSPTRAGGARTPSSWPPTRARGRAAAGRGGSAPRQVTTHFHVLPELAVARAADRPRAAAGAGWSTRWSSPMPSRATAPTAAPWSRAPPWRPPARTRSAPRSPRPRRRPGDLDHLTSVTGPGRPAGRRPAAAAAPPGRPGRRPVRLRRPPRHAVHPGRDGQRGACRARRPPRAPPRDLPRRPECLLMPASQPTILATSMGFASRGRGPYDWRPGRSSTWPWSWPERPSGRGSATWAPPRGTTRCGSPASTGRSPAAPSQVSHLSLFPMPTVRDVRGPPARPGRRLGRRRQRGQPAGGVAASTASTTSSARCGRPASCSAGSPPARCAGTSGGTTDSFGPDLRPVTNGLGLLPYVQRRPLRLRGAAPPAVPPAGRRRHAARRPRHRRRRRAWSTAAPSSSRPSPTGPARRRTGWSAARTARRWRPASSPAFSADAAAYAGAGRAADHPRGHGALRGRLGEQRGLHAERVAGEAPDTCCCWSTRRSTPPASAPSRGSGRRRHAGGRRRPRRQDHLARARASWSATRSWSWPTRSTSSPTSAVSRRR